MKDTKKVVHNDIIIELLLFVVLKSAFVVVELSAWPI